jgi:multidrug resistance efflux pump
MLAGVATLALSAWAFSGSQPATGDPTPDAGTSATVDIVAAPGRVESATEDINLGFEIPGRLEAVLVDEGDRVEAGTVIARLDASAQRAALASARARLSMAMAERDRVLNGARTEERREADAARLQAETAATQADLELRRRKSLFDDGVIAREEYERAERDARLARARLDEVTERARTVQAEARDDDRARATAAVELARAQIAEVEAQLAKTELRAPTAGVIVRRFRRPGETLTFERREMLIVTMADPSRLRVRVDVDETDIARLAVGQTVEITADAYGDRRFTGTVSRVATALGRKNVTTDDPTERTDTKVLETMVDLAPGTPLPLGLRVDAFIRVSR